MIAKSEIPNIFVACMAAIFCVQVSYAQFHTITKGSLITAREYAANKHTIVNETDISTIVQEKCDTAIKGRIEHRKEASARGGNISKSFNAMPAVIAGLPELTVPNLIAEIERNNIRYPKIVLAQAILETGWLTSSVCHNKHNLFGLTNPRTGKYYEFNHWTESVRAYYTKVQYRYKGGNYLLWLKKIGYAEDPGYIRAVIRVMRLL